MTTLWEEAAVYGDAFGQIKDEWARNTNMKQACQLAREYLAFWDDWNLRSDTPPATITAAPTKWDTAPALAYVPSYNHQNLDKALAVGEALLHWSLLHAGRPYPAIVHIAVRHYLDALS